MTQTLITRLSKLDAPDRTTAATKQKIREAFRDTREVPAVLRDAINKKLCQKHIVRQGARYHVPSWSMMCGKCTPYADFSVQWCSEPFCEENRAGVIALIEHGHDERPVPQPALKEWLGTLLRAKEASK
ncbi:hypothetical protein [Brucella intermedia]|uniref:hypothetical protein n=1 Tax=Brucella intermedia TaxID=94625 RepID=UPI00124E5E7D|nr:hypothetical protein [Brucella intermedia]KAB2709674.1 hypothetical protein F9K80_10405 [Brucella intermedia]